jgi:hypothetical protein
VRQAGTVRGRGREDAPSAGAERAAASRSSRWALNDLPCVSCTPLRLISRRNGQIGEETADSHRYPCRILPNKPICGRYSYPTSFLSISYIKKSGGGRQGQSNQVKAGQSAFLLRRPGLELFTSPGKTYSPTHPMSSPARPTGGFSGGKPADNFSEKSACNHYIWGYTPPHSTMCGLSAANRCRRLSERKWPLDGWKNRATLKLGINN